MQYINQENLARKDEIQPVTKDNLHRVKQDAKEMIRLCFKRHGRHGKAFAIAHPQVSAKPLTFFVTQTGNVYINPTVIARDGAVALRSEGCMSFPQKGDNTVTRHYRVTVRYQTLDFDDLYEDTFEDVRGQIMQHEIDHLNGITVYDYNEEVRDAYREGDHKKIQDLINQDLCEESQDSQITK